MKIYLVIGQRKEKYAGEYAPELLDAIDEYGNDENPLEWAEQRRDLYRGTSEFEAVEILTISVADRAIDEKLRPTSVVKADIV